MVVFDPEKDQWIHGKPLTRQRSGYGCALTVEPSLETDYECSIQIQRRSYFLLFLLVNKTVGQLFLFLLFHLFAAYIVKNSFFENIRTNIPAMDDDYVGNIQNHCLNFFSAIEERFNCLFQKHSRVSDEDEIQTMKALCALFKKTRNFLPIYWQSRFHADRV